MSGIQYFRKLCMKDDSDLTLVTGDEHENEIHDEKPKPTFIL